MNSQSKSAPGQLLESGNVVAEVSVVVTLLRPARENERPEYQMALVLEGYRPELDNKSLLLKLPSISGNVFLLVTGIPDTSETRFTAVLEGPVWHNVEWFNSL